MNPLPPRDQHHLTAARGWLELGSISEANQELETITPAFRVHPDVLELRWEIYAQRKMWVAAFEMAAAICELDSGRASGWIRQAYCLNELDRTQQACELLQKVVEKFPGLPIIPYSLACYTCRLKRPAEAMRWLEMAMERGDRKQIKRLACREPDLKPLWSRLKTSGTKPAVRTRPVLQRRPTGGGLPGVHRRLLRAHPRPSGGRFRTGS